MNRFFASVFAWLPASIACLVALPAEARADDVPQHEAPAVLPETPPQDTRILVGPGMYAGQQSDDAAGVLLEGMALHRWGLLEGGAVLELGGTIPGNFVSGAGAFGLGWRNRGLAVDALGEIGVDSYSGIGGQLFGSDPGTSGTLPFAGVRVGLSYSLFPHWDVHPEIGLWGFVEDDLGRLNQTYTYQSNATGFFSDGQQGPETASHVVGDLRGGGLLTLGIAFDGGRRSW